jgi:hypothetical protein
LPQAPTHLHQHPQLQRGPAVLFLAHRRALAAHPHQLHLVVRAVILHRVRGRARRGERHLCSIRGALALCRRRGGRGGRCGRRAPLHPRLLRLLPLALLPLL